MNIEELARKLETEGKSILDIRFPLNNPEAYEELKKANESEDMDGNYLNFLINAFEISKVKPLTVSEICDYYIDSLHHIRTLEGYKKSDDEVYLLGIRDAMQFNNYPYYYKTGVGQIIDKYGTWEDNEEKYPVETTDVYDFWNIKKKIKVLYNNFRF